jgi:hypothetical protein
LPTTNWRMPRTVDRAVGSLGREAFLVAVVAVSTTYAGIVERTLGRPAMAGLRRHPLGEAGELPGPVSAKLTSSLPCTSLVTSTLARKPPLKGPEAGRDQARTTRRPPLPNRRRVAMPAAPLRSRLHGQTVRYRLNRSGDRHLNQVPPPPWS